MIRRITFVLLAFAALAGAPPAGWAQSGEFKGMPRLSQELQNRIAPRDMTLDLDWFLPAPGLDYLLGKWSSFGAEHSFHNGQPNPLSMVLWHVTLSNFAQKLGDWCEKPPLTFEVHFAATLWQLCAWPAASAKQEDVLLPFWIALMGFSAPRAEYVAWRDFFLTSSYRDKPAREAVPAMALAIMLNPHFLLRP